MEQNETMRINKYLARCGVCSRRDADVLVSSGEVMIDGHTASLGEVVGPQNDVRVSGRKVTLNEESIVIAYYKPVGVTCTEKDPHAKRTIFDEISSDKKILDLIGPDRRVTYAGRLDKDSEGLLILTDDGDLIDAMMRSSNMHEKEYEVTVDKPVTDDIIKKMSSGIYIEELHRKTRRCKVTRTGEFSINIVLTQGLNRQIRRMCDYLNLKVLSLKRTRVMNVGLENLQVGASRILTPEEKKQLYSECGLHI